MATPSNGQRADLRQLAYATAFKRLRYHGYEMDRDYSTERLVSAIASHYPTDEEMDCAAQTEGLCEQMARTAGGYACSEILGEVEAA